MSQLFECTQSTHNRLWKGSEWKKRKDSSEKFEKKECDTVYLSNARIISSREKKQHLQLLDLNQPAEKPNLDGRKSVGIWGEKVKWKMTKTDMACFWSKNWTLIFQNWNKLSKNYTTWVNTKMTCCRLGYECR